MCIAVTVAEKTNSNTSSNSSSDNSYNNNNGSYSNGFYSEEDYDSEDTEEEVDKLAEMFEKAKFIVAFRLSELENHVSEANEINVKYNRNCFCYDGHTTFNTSKVFRIKSQNNCKLTIGYVLKQLEKQEFSPGCDHIFIESFDRIDDIDNIPTYEVALGS